MKLSWESVIYGPVDSRRLGKSLGINLLPYELKICNFDCVYCYCGPTKKQIFSDGKVMEKFPSVEQIQRCLREGFEFHLVHKTPIDYITFAGNGEPTMHPAFPAIVEYVLMLRNRYFPQTPTAIFSNSSMLHDNDVVKAISKLDKNIMKIDAGDEETFQRINKPIVDTNWQEIVDNLRRLDGIILNSAVLDSEQYSNVASLKSKGYEEAIRLIKPQEVHLYSIDRPTGYGGISRVSMEILQDIARWLSERTGVFAKVLQNKNPTQHIYVRAEHAVE